MTQEVLSTETDTKASSHWLRPTQALSQKFQLPESQTTPTITEQKKIPRFSFTVGDINFAINTQRSCEVSEIPSIFKLPNTQHWLRGVTNIRGNIVPVFDIGIYLNLQTETQSKSAKLLIAGEQENMAAIIIDNLPSHQNFNETEQLHQLPPMPARLRAHVHGAFSRKSMLWFDIDYESFLLAVSKEAML